MAIPRNSVQHKNQTMCFFYQNNRRKQAESANGALRSWRLPLRVTPVRQACPLHGYAACKLTGGARAAGKRTGLWLRRIRRLPSRCRDGLRIEGEPSAILADSAQRDLVGAHDLLCFPNLDGHLLFA